MVISYHRGGRGACRFRFEDEEMGMRLRETSKRIPILESDRASNPYGFDKVKGGNFGRLEFTTEIYWGFHGRETWRDGKRQRIEQFITAPPPSLGERDS